MGGPSNSGVISTNSGAGLTRIVIPISKEFGLELQETTQQVVKEMGMLLHMLLSKFSGLAVLAHQILLPEGVPLQISRKVVPIVVGGRGKVSRTQELLTKIRTICVEIRDIKGTSQKQYIKTPFKGQDKDSLRTTGRNYNNPPRKEEEQDDKPDYSHMASASPSLSSPPTDSSDSRRRCAGEEASSPAAYPSALPSPSPPHATPPDLLPPSEGAFEPADEDLKGCTIGPCSTGIQMDDVLEGRTEGRTPSSCGLLPETQVWKD